MKNPQKWKIFGVVIIVLLFIDFIRYQITGKTQVKSSTNLVPPDPTRRVRTYDFYKEEWVYEDESRAKANKGPVRKRNNGEDIQEYLEQHIDGYKESTYWGEEYEFNDEDDDGN